MIEHIALLNSIVGFADRISELARLLIHTMQPEEPMTDESSEHWNEPDKRYLGDDLHS
jgi:hypothetical protein